MFPRENSFKFPKHCELNGLDRTNSTVSSATTIRRLCYYNHSRNIPSNHMKAIHYL